MKRVTGIGGHRSRGQQDRALAAARGPMNRSSIPAATVEQSLANSSCFTLLDGDRMPEVISPRNDWHSQENEDELFYVLQGSLTIEMEDRSVVLHEGDAFVVPKGVRHNPVAERECHITLIERKTTLHTGTEVTQKTRSLAEQVRTD